MNLGFENTSAAVCEQSVELGKQTGGETAKETCLRRGDRDVVEAGWRDGAGEKWPDFILRGQLTTSGC